jgi:haloacetate dehalogenase
MLDGFATAEVQTGETSIFVRRAGSGAPVLLLHGFPETHLMWRGVAPLLAQPEPLPERLVAAAPEAIIDDALGGWGSPAAAFTPEVRAAYVAALRDPARIHAICEEYRAAATLDRGHDAADRQSGRRIACPLLALWGSGLLDQCYAEAGGPLALWREWADNVQGHALDAGHFFPEEMPEETADALQRFFARTTAGDR